MSFLSASTFSRRFRVITFASLGALAAADLVPGFYQVLSTPRFITYWDGSTFDPPIPE